MTALTHYELLGVSRNASDHEIKRAFRQAALRWHPDKNPDNREAAEKHFKELTLAYEDLCDARRRAQYELQNPQREPNSKWENSEAAAEVLDPFFSMFTETGTACQAAESILGQMGSLDFADAMFKFCQRKIDGLGAAAYAAAPAADAAQAVPRAQAREAAPQGPQQPPSTPTSTKAASPVLPGVAAREDTASTTSGSDSPPPSSSGSPSIRERWSDVEDDVEELPEGLKAAFGKSKGPERPTQETTLRDQLEELRNQDERCVLLVRGINRLGFESKAALTTFFSSTGMLRTVYVTNSIVKASGKRRERVRPAALGFVLLESPEAVERELSLGEHREIEGIAVKIMAFRHSQSQEEA